MNSAKEYLGRLALIVATVVLTFAALEIASRLWRGPGWLLYWPHLPTQVLKPSDDRCGNLFDDRLGWVTSPNCATPSYHHDAKGFRVVPGPPGQSLGEPAVLVTGASFSYGDEVSDGETWAAYLQGLIHRKVINAGVTGYSLDQTVLRSEQLAKEIAPAAMIVTFTADDVARGELSRVWGAEKPYFELVGGRLELRHVPVPQSEPVDLFWQKALGWSLVAEKVVRALDEVDWWYANRRRALPKGAGESLACPLMRRLAQLSIPTLVVAQYPPRTWRDTRKFAGGQRRLTGIVLRCAEEAGLGALDTFQIVQDAVRARGVDALHRVWHHNSEGNRLIADAVAAELAKRHMLQP